MKTKQYFWMGRKLKVKATYKNHQLYNKVVSSGTGCFIDHYNCEIRCRFNRPMHVMKQAEKQGLTLVFKEEGDEE